MIDTILNIDSALLIFLNNLGNEQWDGFWMTITNQFHWSPLFVFIIYLLFYNFGWKKGGLLLLLMIVMIAFSDQFTNVIRGIFERLRPCNNLEIRDLIRISYSPKNYSFTSGHATSSMTFAVFVVQLFKNKYAHIRWVFLFPIFFAYSRIYLGVHYPVDIIVGALNGTIIALIFYKIATVVSRKLKTTL